MVATATKTSTLSRAEGSVRRLQGEVERLVDRVRKGLPDLNPPETGWFGGLVKEGRRIRGDLRKRIETTTQRAQKRAEEALGGVEGVIGRAIEPVVKRLNLVSRDEFEELRGRLSHLEKRVHDLSKSAEAA